MIASAPRTIFVLQLLVNLRSLSWYVCVFGLFWLPDRMMDGKLPPSFSSAALRPDPDASRNTVVRVENVMKQVNALQQRTKELGEEELVLKEKLRFSKEETQRSDGLRAKLQSELDSVTDEVKTLLVEKKYHQCSAPEEDVKVFESLVEENRHRSLRLRQKEDQIQSILKEAHALMENVAGGQQQQMDPDSVLSKLRHAIDEQDAEIAMLTSLHEEEASLLEEFRENELHIRELRSELEQTGLDIPNAPTVHRTKRILQQREASRAVNNAITTRAILLPVGVLRLLTDRLGTLQAIARSTGVDTFSVEIQDRNTVIHCKGTDASISQLESKLQGTLEYLLSGSFATSGLVTYADRSTGEVCQQAASKISSLLE